MVCVLIWFRSYPHTFGRSFYVGVGRFSIAYYHLVDWHFLNNVSRRLQSEIDVEGNFCE